LGFIFSRIFYYLMTYTRTITMQAAMTTKTMPLKIVSELWIKLRLKELMVWITARLEIILIENNKIILIEKLVSKIVCLPYLK